MTQPQPTDDWLRGRDLWLSRSCGDCSHWAPCECKAGCALDDLTRSERRALDVYLRSVAVTT